MPIGTTAAILLGVGAAGAGFAASKSFGAGKIAQSVPMALPQPPSAEAAIAKGTENAQHRKAAVTQSVYTSPLGVQEQAAVAKKTLLGQ